MVSKKPLAELTYNVQCRVTPGVANFDRFTCARFQHTGYECWILPPRDKDKLPEKKLSQKCEKCKGKDTQTEVSSPTDYGS